MINHPDWNWNRFWNPVNVSGTSGSKNSKGNPSNVPSPTQTLGFLVDVAPAEGSKIRRGLFNHRGPTPVDGYQTDMMILQIHSSQDV